MVPCCIIGCSERQDENDNFHSQKTMNTRFVLYGDEISPPVRFVLMTASMLEIKLDFHNIELFKAENKGQLFTKINPLQKVPALQIGEIASENVICDSHAIAIYLCNVSHDAPDLYPGCPFTKARVNEIMFFNSSTLFPIDSFLFTEYFRGNWPADELKVKQWYSALDHLEYRLNNYAWLTSDKVSLADLCCAATVSSLQLLLPSLDRHPKVRKWLEKSQTLPCYEINKRGLDRLHSFVKKSD